MLYNGKVVSKADHDRYQALMAKKKSEADAKAKAEAEARAKAEAEAAAKAPVEGTADAPALDLKDVSDEDFLKTLG